MFMGEYNHTIDAKGRLIIPAKFREVLGDEFVVTKGMDGCLFVFDNPEWQVFADKLRGLPMIDKEARQFTRFFLAGAAGVEVDKQGRILLPAVLREFADITKDVVLLGVVSRVEIWSRERWEGTVTYQDMEEISRHMVDLGGLCEEFWHNGIVTEGGRAMIAQLEKNHIPYITATHDVNNPKSGEVMKRLGMKYCYSYEEQWQPKDILVTFRLYQLNLDEQKDRIYKKYWENSSVHYIEHIDS